MSSNISIVCKYRIFLPTCLVRIRIVKVEIHSFHLKESSNDKSKKQDQVSACLGVGGVDRRLHYIKVTTSSVGDFNNI